MAESARGAPIKLGLDLNGGVLFVLNVDTSKAWSEKLEGIGADIKQYLRTHKVRGLTVKSSVDDKLLLLPGAGFNTPMLPLVKELTELIPHLQTLDQRGETIELGFTHEEKNAFHQSLMQQSLSTLRMRIERLGITEAIIQRQGKSHIRIELPGVKDPKKAKRIIGSTATLDVYQLSSNATDQASRGFRFKNGEAIRVASKPVFSGRSIQDARAGVDEMGAPLVNLVLDAVGGRKMSDFSKANVGKPMVTVFSEYVDNNRGDRIKESSVINVATVLTPLSNRFSITNMDTTTSANELAMLLRAGSLEAPITFVEQRTVNASLGQQNVKNGFAALALGIGLTLIFMLCWYRKLGLIANAALLVNLVCLIGLMALVPGMVLTLPGIAGLVLTVGMAVDTNVLIFERIKEEKAKGRSSPVAIEAGYKQAFTTILDANVTTMLTALILLSIGNGPVKGFAMTLSLGLLTSMFSGVFVSKVLTRFVNPRIPFASQEKQDV